MTARRASRRSARKKRRNSSLASNFSNFLLVALVILAAAGWYTTNHKNGLSSATSEVRRKDFAENTIAVPEFKSPNKRSSPSASDTNVLTTTLPLPSPLHNSPTVLDIIKTASIASVEPPLTKHKDDQLPPVSRFNPANGAYAIITAKKTIIYQDANTQSKQIAVIAPGKEIRSYDEQNGWHHVVVPSSAIIGWAKADTLKVVSQ